LEVPVLTRCCALVTLLLTPAMALAQPAPSRFQQADDRFKADILLVTTHPDDETGVIPYLVKAVHDEKRRVAVVFTTAGGSGTNDVGRERAGALGAVREIESRRALDALGITNVWFLSNRDLATQDVLVTLGAWRHGASVEELVRLIRLVRPEVVLTFLPAVVAGENHGNHQATGVLATEAFDLAGDPAAFPSQVAAPVSRYESSLENLRPWQAKKLYYFSDASHGDFQRGTGPRYPIESPSPPENEARLQLTARAFNAHLTQFGGALAPAVAKNPAAIVENYRYEDIGDAALFLIRGKTIVPGAVDEDVMAGTGGGPAPFAGPPAYQAPTDEPPVLRTGGPWAFYREFWRAHGLAHLATLVGPELEISGGTPFRIPVLLRRHAGAAETIALTASLPAGWKTTSGPGIYALDPGEEETVVCVVVPPAVKKAEWAEVRIGVVSGGAPAGSVVVRIHVRPHDGIDPFDQ
jgi:LmbE family N-acetylglucosaminyl deacetylase